MKIQKKIMKVNYRNGLNGNILRPLTTLKGLHTHYPTIAYSVENNIQDPGVRLGCSSVGAESS